MERINLSVLSGVSHEGMLQLKSYVDMTGSDPQHQSYDYECLFPENCNPREICLSFIKAADKYTTTRTIVQAFMIVLYHAQHS